MKSIKGHQYNKSDLKLNNILGQSLWYARCGTLSVSLMSGFGLPWNYDGTRVREWLRVLDNRIIENNIPENLMLLRAVYKKGSPHYYNAYNGNRNDYQNFLWDDSSFKKIITPTSQSYLIMDEIMLAKYFCDCSNIDFQETENIAEKKALSLYLINSAVIQAQFMSDYLRNYDGLFISKIDKSESPYGQPHLEDIDKQPAVSEQALALEAFCMLANTLENKAYPLLENPDFSTICKKYAEEIYVMFHNSFDDIFLGKTKELCNIISACIEYYKTNPNDKDILNYITTLSLELESRIDMSGNVLRFPDHGSLTSNSSCFLAVKTLIQAYKVTGIYKFQKSADLVYKKLNLLWDPYSNLYSLDSDDKYKYTLRDVGSVIGGLNAIRLFGEDEYRQDSEYKLVSFFNAAVNTSGLVQASQPPPRLDDCEGYFSCSRNNTDSIIYEDFCSPGIPQSLEAGLAPVFGKKFTYKPKKRKYNINSTSFYSDYALYTVNEMFYMAYPFIHCYYEKEDT